MKEQDLDTIKEMIQNRRRDTQIKYCEVCKHRTLQEECDTSMNWHIPHVPPSLVCLTCGTEYMKVRQASTIWVKLDKKDAVK